MKKAHKIYAVIVARYLFLLLLAWVILFFSGVAHGQVVERDYRGIIHLHSHLSHDSDGTFEDIDTAAQKHSVDFIVMTDHWNPELFDRSRRGMFGNTLFIAGVEISKNDGVTMLAFPLPRYFTPIPDWQKNLRALRANGAVVVADHIEFSTEEQLAKFDAIELTNLHAHILDRSPLELTWTWFRAVPWWNWDLKYLIDHIKNMPRWRTLLRSASAPLLIVGNDTHDNYRLFYKIGPKLGSYDNTFPLMTTHIWAPELTEQAIVEALRKGTSFVAFEIHGRATGFRFYATNKHNVAFLPGNTVALEGTLSLTIVVPPQQNNPRAKNIRIEVFKDGRLITYTTGLVFVFSLSESGAYHVEILKDNKLWIVANPIEIH